MKHAEILLKVEKMLPENVDIVGVTRVEKITIDKKSTDVVPGKNTQPGEYGVVDLRILLPINESV